MRPDIRPMKILVEMGSKRIGDKTQQIRRIRSPFVAFFRISSTRWFLRDIST